MTQEQLDAGADAVAGLAAKYGYSAYISRDQQREIAAAVIWAYLRAEVPGARSPSLHAEKKP